MVASTAAPVAVRVGEREAVGTRALTIPKTRVAEAAEPIPDPTPEKFRDYGFIPFSPSMGYHPDGDIKVPHEMVSPLHARRAKLEQEIAEIDRHLEKLAQPRSLGPLPDRILRLMSSC